MVLKTAKRLAEKLNRRKVEKRELRLVVKIQGQLFVIQPPLPVLLNRGERTGPVVYKLLHPALPLFTTGMNIVHQPNRRWPARFVFDHTEYDVVEIGFCDMLGLKEGDTPTAALIRNGFKIVPLEGYPLEADMRRVLSV